MSRLLGLYPRAWRRRYGEELRSLTAARPMNARDWLDLVLGAIDAHLHPELVTSEPSAGQPMRDLTPDDLRIARRLGAGAMFGAVAWLAAWVIAANGPIVYDPGGSYRDGAAALPVLPSQPSPPLARAADSRLPRADSLKNAMRRLGCLAGTVRNCAYTAGSGPGLWSR